MLMTKLSFSYMFKSIEFIRLFKDIRYTEHTLDKYFSINRIRYNNA